MAIHNRESFLDKVASRLGRKVKIQGVERPEWSVTPQKSVFNSLTQDELVDVLEIQCNAIHTAFKRTNREDLVKVLDETLDSYGCKEIIMSNDVRYEQFGLVKYFEEQKNQLNVHVWDPSIGKDNQKIAERADVGIVFSDITLAESGTVTLFNNKDNGRSISLLPRTFIAIIPKSTLVPRMTQAAKYIHQAQATGQEVPSYVSFITGPSNSADIEMKLIVGVHGPIKATYIVVD